MKNDYQIPAEFFKGFTSDGFFDLCVNRNGILNAMECLRLWKLAGWTDPCPTSLQLMVRKEDVMRLFPPKKKEI